MEITAQNANDMFSEMFWRLRHGEKADSRNGPVVRIMEPVLTTVLNPMQRVLFHEGRDANPIFHLMEAIWMLAGRRDVHFVQQFNSKIGQYSDDGKVFNAAYGYRWRHHFGHDQLKELIAKLKADPGTRQAVVQMWDSHDLSKDTKDRACNMQLIFEVLDGELNMTVINRSNDAWYGYAGANIVHFTVLQEFVAGAVGLEVGKYRTFTTNLHLYTQMYDAARYLHTPPSSKAYDAYRKGIRSKGMGVTPDNWESWLLDAEAFCDNPFGLPVCQHDFFSLVAHPMAMISYDRKNGGNGYKWADMVTAEDWREAATQWISRREAAKAR